ncbi:molybdopterin-dependent oxidoreductase [Microbacterium karelineae]|uniref:molybdopterin-dependent oxidoreductase n=1 Tax=Microbacterium karelineae TaxID=2654283 RepID=UPI0012EAE496|nr:molybdopterin-dependent oxidoreductase [Microbacterium karelineae]
MSDSALHASHWGAFRARVQDGRIVEAIPFEEDPDPADLLGSVPDVVHAANRVARPAVRRGWLEGRSRVDAPRGADEFVEVDWDTAIDLVAREITRVRREHGSEAIFGGSYGWASAGRFHHAKTQMQRFLAASGGYTGHVGTYSFGASSVILPHVLGFDANTSDSHAWDDIAEHTETWLMLGGVPTRNMKVDSGGVGAHRGARGLARALAGGARAINVNPIRDEAPTGAEWQPIRPGTDVALLLGLAHTLLVEDRHDRAFLDAHTTGFDRFADHLRGASDGIAKDADWASGITGIAAERIRGLARDMSVTRTLITTTWSLQRAEHGEQPYWMTVVLAAMLGGIGRPGEGFAFGFGSTDGIGSGAQRFRPPSHGKGDNPLAGREIPVARIVDALEDPGGAYDFDGERRTYPDIRLVYWAGGNPFHHHQDLGRLRAAWQRPDTVIVNEPWWTPTAKHADIVLPATTTLERDDIAASSSDDWIVAMKRAVDPVGEALDDSEIFRRLSLAVGLDAPYGSVDDALREMYEAGRASAARIGVDLPIFDEFWERGSTRLARVAPRNPLARLRAGEPLATPSGRIEIFSETIDGYGYDDCLGHPAWLPPREWATGYPLHLISHQPATRLHSQLDGGSVSRAAKIRGREACRISPTDAAARGIRDGDVVRLFNDRGSCLAGAAISDAVMPGVVALPTGAWFDPDPETGIERHGNPNVLTADRGTSKLAQGTTAQTTLVDIERFDGDLPPVEAFDPPRIARR